MKTDPSLPSPDSPSGQMRWAVALAVIWIVSATAFAFGLHQFVLKFLYDQSSYTRTLGGVLLIVLSIAAIALPIVLRRNRLRFQSLRPSRQWLLAAGIPLIYVLVLAVCLQTSHRSRTIILQRPFTPTAIIHYRHGDSRIEFRGGWRPDVNQSGSNDAELLPDGSEEFSGYLHETFIRDALGGRQTVAIVGRAKRNNDGTVRISLEVDAREAIRFDVDNLKDVEIMRDGRPIAKSQSQVGTFHVSIAGRSPN